MCKSVSMYFLPILPVDNLTWHDNRSLCCYLFSWMLQWLIMSIWIMFLIAGMVTLLGPLMLCSLNILYHCSILSWFVWLVVILPSTTHFTVAVVVRVLYTNYFPCFVAYTYSTYWYILLYLDHPHKITSNSSFTCIIGICVTYKWCDCICWPQCHTSWCACSIYTSFTRG